MLPPTCSRFACRNIDVTAVAQVGGWAGGVPTTPGWPLHSTVWEKPAAAIAQWLARWVNS